MSLKNTEASRNILSYIEDGRLIQKSWYTERDGRVLGCLLHAAGDFRSTADCPAELMPSWVAECTVTMFDGLSKEDVVPVSRRYANLIGRWHVLTPDGWNNVLARWLVRLIDQAVDAVPAAAKTESYWPDIEKACALSKEAIVSKDKDKAAWAARAARAAAEAAAWAARAAAEAAAWAAWAARAAAEAAAEAAAAWAAAVAAAEAAWAARAAAEEAAAAAAWAAAAYKSLFSALLDEIEIEIIHVPSAAA
jgi:hypothetical protein